jgi:spore maturation protein SpmA
MVFMLGIMRVAFDGGLRDWIARALAPLLVRIFPEIPPDHPAMSALVMNMASNMLGMGNAATPFGIKAMVEMDKLNRYPGSASNAMVLFLAVNTSAITLLPPSGTMGVRLAAGSSDPAAIWIPTLIATTFSTLAAVGMFYLLRQLPIFRHKPIAEPLPSIEPTAEEAQENDAPASESKPPRQTRGLSFGGEHELRLMVAKLGVRHVPLSTRAPRIARVLDGLFQGRPTARRGVG